MGKAGHVLPAPKHSPCKHPSTGITPLTSPFPTPPYHLQIGPFDRLSIKGLKTFAPGVPLKVVGKRPDGTTYEFTVNQTFNENQIEWFQHGSALNAMGAKFAKVK